MNREMLFEMESPNRGPLRISAYSFGYGEPSVCIVGPTRGNEIQQLYICSQLIQRLMILEKKGSISKNHKILVIPSLNHLSMNVSKRFWALDDTDINRKFPGDLAKDTTERITANVFKTISKYTYGIQFASFYIPGVFIPHIRMMGTDYNNASLATLFGLKYVLVREPKAVDRSTLNYNWQQSQTQAFSLYTNQTDRIDPESAKEAVNSILRFLNRMGIVKHRTHSGYISGILEEDHLNSISTSSSGIFRSFVKPGDEVNYGDVMAEIIHPYEGYVIDTILSPTNGVIFFAHTNPLVMESQIVFMLIHRRHI